MAQRVAPVQKSAGAPARRATAPQAAGEIRQGPRRDFVESIWVLFCSVKFAVALNVGLAFVVMLGTVIPQVQPGIQTSAEALAAFAEIEHAIAGGFVAQRVMGLGGRQGRGRGGSGAGGRKLSSRLEPE